VVLRPGRRGGPARQLLQAAAYWALAWGAQAVLAVVVAGAVHAGESLFCLARGQAVIWLLLAILSALVVGVAWREVALGRRAGAFSGMAWRVAAAGAVANLLYFGIATALRVL
jgi:hypothetical protein